MSHVHLFVQVGDGRPKYVGRAYPRSLDHRGRTRSLVHRTEGALWWAAPWVAGEARSADRWWLVECENAEAGRVAIADAVYRPTEALIKSEAWAWIRRLPLLASCTGRILASGGKP